MSRRYLSVSEAQNALSRGKSIEAFIGSCCRDNSKGIKWASIRYRNDTFITSIYETADLGDEDYLDIYSFGPLNPELDYEEADLEFKYSSFESTLSYLELQFPGLSKKLVNEFVIQDEYKDYIIRGRCDT